MRKPVAVFDVGEDLVFQQTGIDGHTLSVVASEEGQPHFTIVDIEGTNIRMLFLPIQDGIWKLIVFDYKPEPTVLEEYLNASDSSD